MSILSVIFAIVLVGVLLWALNRFMPMDAKVRQILNVVVVILLVVWLLDVFGVFAGLRGVNVPRGNSRGVGCSVGYVGR